MAFKVLLLVMIVFTMSAAGTSSALRDPTCRDVKDTTVCTRDEIPVCGTDEITYRNECMLCLSKLRDPKLMIAKMGPCDADKRES